MYLPKSDIFSWLKTLPYSVLQKKPPIFNTLPAITFKVGNNNVNLELDNTIGNQDIEIIIDLWANDSVTASQMLSDVEALMREHDYIMVFSGDIDDPSGLYHTSTRFNKIVD